MKAGQEGSVFGGKMDIDKTNFEEVLRTRGHLVYYTTGYSMLPLLRQRRDVVVIEAKGERKLKKYDIVLFRRANHYVLHRIVRILPHELLILGDNNTFLEHGITEEQILGVVTKIIRDEKEFSVEDWRYRLYVHLWCDVYPVRMALTRIKRTIGNVLRWLKRKLNKT